MLFDAVERVIHLSSSSSLSLYLSLTIYMDRIVFLMMSMLSCIWDSLITRGGAKRMISPCVGLASKPFSLSLMQTSQASCSVGKGEMNQ